MTTFPAPPTPATGTQHQLTLISGRSKSNAVITEVAAGLRHLDVNGINLVAGYDVTIRPPFCSGIVLIPWPNRIRDGRWIYHGTPMQLDITEPNRNNAIHGLLQYTPYRVSDRSDSAITLTAQVFPQNGYPFHLDTAVRYELQEDGLSATHTITNIGAQPAPVAIGAHPFLTLGDIPVEELTLTVAAERHIVVDERLNPIGSRPVAGTPMDLRSGQLVAGLDLDDAWSDLVIVDGGSTHALTAPDGRSVSLWADDQHNYLQVFTTRRYPRDGRHITAIAIEPMTAPANAFNSGDGLTWVAAGEQWSASWAIRYNDGVGRSR
ncbi:MAG: aldose 1-epimerase family protein [Gordonia sp. (in: high G+C Gram-positive bacteria)]